MDSIVVSFLLTILKWVCVVCLDPQWCYKKKCVEIGERPAAVNGEWGGWGEWTQCSRSCGGGTSMRERLCNNPPPSDKGRYCLGKRHEYNMCNTQVSPCLSNTCSHTVIRSRRCTHVHILASPPLVTPSSHPKTHVEILNLFKRIELQQIDKL